MSNSNDNNRGFKGVWIPKEVWLNPELRRNRFLRDLLVEIHSLDNEKGCFANNQYFADFFFCTKENISQSIQKLEQKGFISITYATANDNASRVIRINKAKYYGTDRSEAELHRSEAELHHNNTYNNTYNNTLSLSSSHFSFFGDINLPPVSRIIVWLENKLQREINDYVDYLKNHPNLTEGASLLLERNHGGWIRAYQAWKIEGDIKQVTQSTPTESTPTTSKTVEMW